MRPQSKAFPVLSGIEALTLFADNDQSGAGLAAAMACAESWHAARREALVQLPRGQGCDWADEWGVR